MQTGMPDLSCACAFKPEAGFQGGIHRLMLPGYFQRSRQWRNHRLSAADGPLRQWGAAENAGN
jgi:hypothetical protein